MSEYPSMVIVVEAIPLGGRISFSRRTIERGVKALHSDVLDVCLDSTFVFDVKTYWILSMTWSPPTEAIPTIIEPTMIVIMRDSFVFFKCFTFRGSDSKKIVRMTILTLTKYNSEHFLVIYLRIAHNHEYSLFHKEHEMQFRNVQVLQ